LTRKGFGPVGFVVPVVLAVISASAHRIVANMSDALPHPRFTAQQLTERAANISGQITHSSEPLNVTVTPRPTRGRNGMLNVSEVLCHTQTDKMVTFFCWDTVSGDLLFYSRDMPRGLPAALSVVDSNVSKLTAAQWLRSSDLPKTPASWRVTRVEPRSSIRWIVFAESEGRKAYVMVDRKTGFVVNSVTWQPRGGGQVAG